MFSVVEIGSRAFKQLPSVDQARMYLQKTQLKENYLNKVETKYKLQNTFRECFRN